MLSTKSVCSVFSRTLISGKSFFILEIYYCTTLIVCHQWGILSSRLWCKWKPAGRGNSIPLHWYNIIHHLKILIWKLSAHTLWWWNFSEFQMRLPVSMEGSMRGERNSIKLMAFQCIKRRWRRWRGEPGKRLRRRQSIKFYRAARQRRRSQIKAKSFVGGTWNAQFSGPECRGSLVKPTEGISSAKTFR